MRPAAVMFYRLPRPKPPARTLWGALLSALSAGEIPAAFADERTWRGTLYVSRWINSDLAELPTNAIGGKLSFRDTSFAGVGITKVIVPGFDVTLPILNHTFANNSIELEGQALHHFGQEHHVEGAASILWRTGNVSLLSGASMNFGFGIGGSYAFAKPKVEGVGFVRPRRYLNYLVVETELSHRDLPWTHLVLRVHHRSGIFGLIAPKHSGSNYIGVGLRFDLP